MDCSGQNDLEAIRREQAELKRRIAALDKAIASLETAREAEPVRPAMAMAPPPASAAMPEPPAPPALPPPLPLALPLAPEAPPLPVVVPSALPVETLPALAMAPSPTGSASAADPGAPPAKTNGDGLELRLGTYWLVRVGVVMLLTGFVFLANHYLFSDRLGPGTKVAILYVLSFGLLGTGVWLERTRETLRNYGQVLGAGGLAAVYFTTFAAHRVEALQVITSPVLAGLLLLIWAGCMVALAEWRQSQTLAVMGVLLAYYTLIMNPGTMFSLFSALVLAGAAMVLQLRNRWIVAGSFSMAGTYLAYAFWRYPHLLEWLRDVPANPADFWRDGIFLICYWAVFTLTAFLPSPDRLPMTRRALFAGLNNVAFLVLFGLATARYFPDQFWVFSLVSGSVLCALSVEAGRRFDPNNALAHLLLTKGLVLITLAAIVKLSGVSLALTLAGESTVLLVMALQSRNSGRGRNAILEAGAYISALLSAIYTLNCESAHALFLPRSLHDSIPRDLPTLAAIGQGLFLFFNAFWIRYAGRAPAVSSLENRDRLIPQACLFVILGIFCVTVGGLYDLPSNWRPAAFLAAGLLAAAAGEIPRVRLRELALLGQVFSLLAIGFLLANLRDRSVPPVESVPLVLGILALAHWAGRSSATATNRVVRRFFEIAFSLGFTVLTLASAIELEPAARTWLYLAGLMAAAQFAYGLGTRALYVAAFSQLYHFAGFSAFFQESSSAILGALPMALILLNVIAIDTVLKRARDDTRFSALEARAGLIRFGLFVLRVLALCIFLAWADIHFSEPWQVLLYAVAASGLFALAITGDNAQRHVFSLVLLGATALGIAPVVLDGRAGHWQLFAACLAPLAMQQCLRQFSPPGPTAETANSGGPLGFIRTGGYRRVLSAGLITVGVGLLWMVLSSAVEQRFGGFYLAVSWSLLAFGVFAAGWWLEERLYRLLSLALLGAAILRVLVVDVWTLDNPLARIWSFIAIGLVLLALGFVYSRFQIRLRRFF